MNDPKSKAATPYNPDEEDGEILTVEANGTITTEKPTDVRFRTEWNADVMGPPLHPNCRCTPAHVVMDEVALSPPGTIDQIDKEIEAMTRNHAHDDQVDAIKTGLGLKEATKSSRIHKLITKAVENAMKEDDKMQRERRLKGR